jgi:arylsulfatase
VDVLPTLLELVGGAVPPGLDGVSLAPLLRREPGTEALARSLASRPLAAERLDESGSGRELQSLVRGRWKLIRGPEGEEQLYDLRADPGELHDRSRAEPERTRELAAQLRELWSAGRRSAPARGEIRIDARRLEQLRRLGYVEEEAPAPAR